MMMMLLCIHNSQQNKNHNNHNIMPTIRRKDIIRSRKHSLIPSLFTPNTTTIACFFCSFMILLMGFFSIRNKSTSSASGMIISATTNTAHLMTNYNGPQQRISSSSDLENRLKGALWG
jgi:hypothetical protein